MGCWWWCCRRKGDTEVVLFVLSFVLVEGEKQLYFESTITDDDDDDVLMIRSLTLSGDVDERSWFWRGRRWCRIVWYIDGVFRVFSVDDDVDSVGVVGSKRNVKRNGCC